VARATKRLGELARAERHRGEAELKRSVPGAGLVTAMIFRLELPEPERFETEVQFAKVTGSPPARCLGP
jgi:hypothetical protein